MTNSLHLHLVGVTGSTRPWCGTGSGVTCWSGAKSDFIHFY